MNENQLIDACQQGDRAAFRQLFETYKDQVYSLALNFGRDEAAAQDITQEVFVRLFRTIVQFRRQASFSTWLYRIVVNTCLNEERKKKRLLFFSRWEGHPLVSDDGSAEEAYARRQLEESIQEAVDGLEPSLRIPVLLRYLQGLSYAEIAETMNWSIGTVSSRLNRAHRILGNKLSRFRDQLS